MKSKTNSKIAVLNIYNLKFLFQEKILIDKVINACELQLLLVGDGN